MMTAVGTSRGLVVVQTKVVVQGVARYDLIELTDAKGLGSITSLAFSHSSEKDKVMLAVGTAERVISVWDIYSKKPIATITGTSTSFVCVIDGMLEVIWIPFIAWNFYLEKYRMC